MCTACSAGRFTVEAAKLEHARPPNLNQRKKRNQHESSYNNVSTLGKATPGLEIELKRHLISNIPYTADRVAVQDLDVSYHDRDI